MIHQMTLPKSTHVTIARQPGFATNGNRETFAIEALRYDYDRPKPGFANVPIDLNREQATELRDMLTLMLEAE